jgi:hypothetical protein
MPESVHPNHTMVWVKAGSASVVAGGAKLTCAASAGTGSRQIGDESDDAQHKPSRVDGTGGVAPNTTSAVLIPSGTKFSITTTPGALVFPIEFDDSIELKELRTVELVAEQADYLIYLFAIYRREASKVDDSSQNWSRHHSP